MGIDPHHAATVHPGFGPPTRATYGFFCRLDDLVDEEQISLADFRVWREQANKGLEEQTDPFIITWTYVRERYEIDPQLVDNLLDGIEMDIPF